MNKFFITLLAATAFTAGSAWAQKSTKALPAKPKLVVGIVVDQMRYDFLYRYAEKYSEGGFKRLMREGFNCKNNHYNYVPTYTGPGHTSVYTGAGPAIHGIIGNDWYDRTVKASVYCTEDSSVTSVGSASKAGQMSPRRMVTTTITDQLRLASNMRSKTIGVALKDRGSILPAGHTANAAYWFDSSNGSFITSSFYMKDLPTWVKTFNDKRLADTYLKQEWNTLLPIAQYTESTGDDQPYERPLKGESKAVFPHRLLNNTEANGAGGAVGIDYEPIRTSPWGNSLTKEFALEALRSEQLGMGPFTDFLAISFSSPDYVGHTFGPNAIETEDTYLRLDKDIEEILTELDKRLGKDNVLVFLTADHGVANVVGYNKEQRIPAGTSNPREAAKGLYEHLNKELGEGKWIESMTNSQVYFNKGLMKERGVAREKLVALCKDYIMDWEFIANVVDLQDLNNGLLTEYQSRIIRNGVNAKRSGDLYYIEYPNWMSGDGKGTTHGSIYGYDTHVPLVWYGWKVKQGSTVERTEITDIAPSIASALDILEPSGSIGKPIQLTN